MQHPKHYDVFGQETTLAAGPARDSWDATQMAFMAHGAATGDHLAATVAAAPDFALGQAVKGMMMLLLGRSELEPVAREALAAARAGAPATAREIAFVRALGAWIDDGRPSDAARHLEEVLDQNPTDTLAMKLSHAIRFILGDARTMRQVLEAVLPAYAHDHPGRGYLLGCHAFALEETGDYAKAQTTGRIALGTTSDDAWGLHAVAHVYDMTGDSRGGINWLSGHETAWEHCNNFRYHVWWHKALMHLDQGEVDTVLDLYDQAIRADHTDDYRDISNATSLLSRLELDGVDVGDRWDELATVSEGRTEDGCLIFADLHYLLALIGGGRDGAVRRLMGRMHQNAKASASDMQKRMAMPGLNAGAGLEAFGEGDYRTAFLNLARARRNMQIAGGSHAQRDVFERLTIDAGIRSGFLDEAEGILAQRTARRAGREDRYAAVRRDMIVQGRAAACADRVPAE